MHLSFRFLIPPALALGAIACRMDPLIELLTDNSRDRVRLRHA